MYRWTDRWTDTHRLTHKIPLNYYCWMSFCWMLLLLNGILLNVVCAKCHSSKYCCAQCHCSKCRFAECWGAILKSASKCQFNKSFSNSLRINKLERFNLVKLFSVSQDILGSTMRLFHPANSLVVNRNLWLILLSKIWFFLNLVKHTSKRF